MLAMSFRKLAFALRGLAVLAGLALVATAPPAPRAAPLARPAEAGHYIAQKARFRALVFSRVTNYYHESIPAGVAAIRKLGAEHGFDVVVSDDPAQFTDSMLASFDVVVFNNTNSTP